MQSHATGPPVAPLKNLQNADQQAAKDLRDTPLAPPQAAAQWRIQNIPNPENYKWKK